MRCANDRNTLVYAGRATVPDMTIACSSGAAVRRASEKASSSASSSASSEACANAPEACSRSGSQHDPLESLTPTRG